jgi:DNA-binding LacI/PurR family transcriptional regulator
MQDKGRTAARLLLDLLMRNGKPRHIVLETELIVRGS